MKRLFLVLTLIILLLCGCAKAPAPAPEPEYPAPDPSGIHAVYINAPSGLIPVSVTKDGREELSGDNYYYNLAALDLPDRPLTAFTAAGDDLGAYAPGKPYTMLVTTGNWRLCPPVNVPAPGDEAQAFTKSVLPSAAISAVYELDLDGDGAGEQFILANDDRAHLLVRSVTLGEREICSDTEISPFFADLDGDSAYSLVTLAGGSLKKATVYTPDLAPDYNVFLPLD